MDFTEFPKMPRLMRDVIVTEKIDGTNACVAIEDDGVAIEDDGVTLRAGSRTRWITVSEDNFGFAAWCEQNRDELLKLGPGRHFGEWWGAGIRRRYGLDHKRFSLFNVPRWADDAVRPACCHVVPEIWRGMFDTAEIAAALERLARYGSLAAPGFMKPEGIVVWHVAGNVGFKRTIEKDDEPKGKAGGTKP